MVSKWTSVASGGDGLFFPLQYGFDIFDGLVHALSLFLLGLDHLVFDVDHGADGTARVD